MNYFIELNVAVTSDRTLVGKLINFRINTKRTNYSLKNSPIPKIPNPTNPTHYRPISIIMCYV